MSVDFLLIGQGISGIMLHRFLTEAGYSAIIIDEQKKNSASRVASGVINPVTGRRIVKTWLIDEVLPFARQTYEKMSVELNIAAIKEVSILDFFPTPQMTESFKKRFAEDSEYLTMPSDPHAFDDRINNEFGYGGIAPAYLINLPDILEKSRAQLSGAGQLINSRFNHQHLQVDENRIQYEDLTAGGIIFCDGIGGPDNPYFRNLPFAPNKGEAVLVEIEAMPDYYIYKKGFSLVPWKGNIFWLGSNYLWEFDDDDPTPGFYRFAENWLNQTVKLPFRIVEHLAGVRPATLERRPFVGFHPVHKNVGIFNGMGTKGCSLAPFFGKQFVDMIKTGAGLYKEADVSRFTRVLSRS
jgi:glycine/D-amino acid oxidase-like deaminating enzyme